MRISIENVNESTFLEALEEGTKLGILLLMMEANFYNFVCHYRQGKNECEIVEEIWYLLELK